MATTNSNSDRELHHDSTSSCGDEPPHHPVLVELGLTGVQRRIFQTNALNEGNLATSCRRLHHEDCLSSSSVPTGEDPESTMALRVLNYLLCTNQVSSDVIRNAHAHLTQRHDASPTQDRIPNNGGGTATRYRNASTSSDSRSMTKTNATGQTIVAPASVPAPHNVSGISASIWGGSLSEDGNAPSNSGTSAVDHTNSASSPSTSCRATSTTLRKPTAANSAISSLFSLHFQRHIALRIYYDGGTYTGLAENVGRDSDRSIERELFAALQKAHLIVSRDTCQYSRCGRTDRGVSAAGQVIALHVKSAFRTDMRKVVTPPSQHNEPALPENDTQGKDGSPTDLRTPLGIDDLPKNSFNTLCVECPPRASSKKSSQSTTNAPPPTNLRSMTEYAYDKILNKLLPDNIRILGWTPVSQEFSARFSAQSRTYRYFFLLRPHMDVIAMQQALSYLEGTHDYRNFCKMDVEKVYNFVRTIYQARLVVPSSCYESTATTTATDVGDSVHATNTTNGNASHIHPSDTVAYFEIHGQAFLWHQIRCIASILFLIGHQLESPDLIVELLSVTKHPGKPSYPLASDLPLVLHDCSYEHLHMRYSASNLWNVMCVQQQQYEETLLAAARIRNCLDTLQKDATVLVADVVAFVTDKLNVRHKKQQKQSSSSYNHRTTDGLVHPFGDTKLIRWNDALEWMETLDLIPEPVATIKDAAYIPVLQRCKGPTYEQKVANLHQSAKRQHRYETNVIKKRKTKQEDEEFYRHKMKQGGSNL